MADLSPVRAGECLTLGNGAQLDLIELDGDQLPAEAFAQLESRGRITGERLFSGNPRLYHAIIALIARGLPYREIAEVCQVSVNTVCGVAFRENIPVETLRDRIGRLALDVSSLTMEALRDLLSDRDARRRISAKDLAIIHGIATQNGQLLLGGATARMEQHTATPPSHAAYLEFIQNVTPIGSAAGTPPQKEALPADVVPPAPDQAAAANTPPEGTK